jgi:hypothetical protein
MEVLVNYKIRRALLVSVLFLLAASLVFAEEPLSESDWWSSIRADLNFQNIDGASAALAETGIRFDTSPMFFDLGDLFYSLYPPVKFALVAVAATYIGLSIWTMESVYRDNPRDNWMAPLHASITMAIGGYIATVLLLEGGLIRYNELYWALLITTFLSGGIAGYAVPGLRNAFADNPVLYYIPSWALFSVVFHIIWENSM